MGRMRPRRLRGMDGKAAPQPSRRWESCAFLSAGSRWELRTPGRTADGKDTILKGKGKEQLL